MIQVGKPRSVSTKENTTDGTDAYYRNADCQAINLTRMREART